MFDELQGRIMLVHASKFVILQFGISVGLKKCLREVMAEVSSDTTLILSYYVGRRGRGVINWRMIYVGSFQLGQRDFCIREALASGRVPNARQIRDPNKRCDSIGYSYSRKKATCI